MNCTAPCIPACPHQATSVLLNGESKSVLGHNCGAHIESLCKIKGGNGKFDYDSAPMVVDNPESSND